VDPPRHRADRAARRSAVGGLLSATFGNTAELVLAIFVLLGGHADVVKAQITGSIIGNGLLGFGLAIAIGTWGKRELRFKPQRAGLLSSLLMLVTIALLVPALFNYTERGIFASTQASSLDAKLSLCVAVVLLVVYAANLVYTLVTHRDVFATDEPADERKAAWPLWRSRATAKRRGSKGCC
jgi:Ca2+:H+ antiporter